ncbi:ATP-binding cassette domain-containing protein [Rhizobium lusitanum]|uniref:ATP-binding cassette domain-containing protein n=1 Tax=Rhizobium lusitanum TaxID=293958 RepID=A0A6L9UCI1_9HYPH|nr:oligopeptide/dipeptide ABC transporter ATP-binding protein [Rhizobium lusitanum]NEI73613.1 ATP-binding cassette domain-containing protein [Rhizobium lusitanum]
MTTVTANSAAPLLDVKGLKVHYPLVKGIVFSRQVGVLRAVDDVSFQLAKGSILALVGESGCGKSTTGKAVLDLVSPTAGSVEFDGTELARMKGEPLRRMRRRMQMVFQDPYSSLSPRISIGATLMESLAVHAIGTASDRGARVGDLLQRVGLRLDIRDRYPHELSGGQRQRVGIARALAVSPDLIVADEPTSALDVSIQAQIINLIQRLQDEMSLSYLFISHNISIVRHISDRIAVMYLGRIVESGPTREVIDAPGHPYTKALVSAVRNPDPVTERRRQRIVLTGDVPSAVSPPSGCRFHNRCWLRKAKGNPDICTQIEPQTRPLAAERSVACHFAEDCQ